ncbi:MAG: hypothetical protein Q8M08_08470 [Bacteroidales bacterium]|nr:hypothetical protein [Bacteroidales bacterium]
MMKKIFSYLCLMLFMTAISTAYGQDSQAELRRTAEEQADFEKSVPVNPAKTTTEIEVDPRMVQPQPGPTNWKAQEAPVDDRRNVETDQITRMKVAGQTNTAVNKTQPEGEQPVGKIVNLRDIKGSKTQPEVPESGKVTNYRDIKGSKTQPEGEKPKR